MDHPHGMVREIRVFFVILLYSGYLSKKIFVILKIIINTLLWYSECMSQIFFFSYSRLL